MTSALGYHFGLIETTTTATSTTFIIYKSPHILRIGDNNAIVHLLLLRILRLLFTTLILCIPSIIHILILIRRPFLLKDDITQRRRRRVKVIVCDCVVVNLCGLCLVEVAGESLEDLFRG